MDGVAARDRALETQDERDWRQALLHLERAVALRATGEAQFELGEVWARLGFSAEALAAYEAALALGIDGRAEERARAFVGAHAADVALVELSGPSGANVYVGDRWRGRLPLARPLAVDGGAVALRLELPGFRDGERLFTLRAGQSTRLDVELGPDGSRAPTTSVGVASAAAPGKSAGPRPWVMPALFGGASVFVASGVGFALTSLLLPDARRDLRAHCSTSIVDGSCQGATDAVRASAQSAANRISTLETLRWVSVGGAVAGLASAAVGFLALPSESAASSSSARLDVYFSAAALRLDVCGRF